MIKSMLDVLVCPFDKVSELELFELEVKPIKKKIEHKDEHFKPEDTGIKFSDDSVKDNEVEIVEGILFCNNCLRFYPIVEEIPIILPDELRDKNKDLDFLRKHSSSLPEKIVKKSIPWHL